MKQEKIIEQEMYHRAIELIQKRYPKGWGGAAVVHSEDGQYFTSVSIKTANSSVDLCIEVGAMCEAHKYNVRVTHCLCVVRDDENSPFKVLTPCGVCQERLRFWGTSVKVGVTTQDNTLKFVTLNELQPYHWTNAYPPEELEYFGKRD
ncbi:cytidine deaminase [Paramaledivibacter caminithermalis]|jgi:cytidine deaminase|uniref:Cytidine deaminase n=1 Tax=Paramaledivibacter caminithermalis (strain DSM 15212 / CIP 107654 / DViRD3) TaxID=1121301 RepID=A0A1M6REL1_PARC5|nr:cytidine deaminase [Paramaledivibacter caminithermalis]SHK30914.1 cytidine deaminase [Paramaledivibacter caminithermalis DSM 15212]